MQKAIIIDDERLARNELKKLLLEFPEIEVIEEATNAKEGIEKIETHRKIYRHTMDDLISVVDKANSFEKKCCWYLDQLD